MNLRFNWTRIAQCVVALAGALALKLHYSTASADQLRWILAPTAALVEMVSGASFEFESRAGYISRERGFLIANSCAGVNFLIAAFLTLSMRRLIGDRSKAGAWGFLPTAAVVAYLATLVANTARITVALLLRQSPAEIGSESGRWSGRWSGWMSHDQLHRFEGVFIYFGFLLLLFVVSEKMSAGKTSGSLRRLFLPLLVYYAIALGLPLLNCAYRQGADFWRHALFVLLIPLLLTCGSLACKAVINLSSLPRSRRRRRERDAKNMRKNSEAEAGGESSGKTAQSRCMNMQPDMESCFHARSFRNPLNLLLRRMWLRANEGGAERYDT